MFCIFTSPSRGSHCFYLSFRFQQSQAGDLTLFIFFTLIPAILSRGFSYEGRNKSRGRSSLAKQTEAYYRKKGLIYQRYTE
uniref:Uncharacterized protein n=1 Tax=Picea sitchensis TaxID=3332 RepID=B8LMC1_PICSI|nr:unknown [Picea sitchensis]